jgi:hypothetical protein
VITLLTTKGTVVKVKVKFNLEQTTKVQRGSKEYIILIITV